MLLLDMAYRLLREFRQAFTRLDTPPFSNRRHPGSDIARLQWSEGEGNGSWTHFADHRIVDGLGLWQASRGDKWDGTVELSERFHAELQKHCVPLDKRAIAELKNNSLSLDLYALFAYRLPRLRESLHLRWRTLQSQVGSEETQMKELARRVRSVMPDVMAVYPHAKVEITPTGITLRKSEPPVPSRAVRGYRVIESVVNT